MQSGSRPVGSPLERVDKRDCLLVTVTCQERERNRPSNIAPLTLESILLTIDSIGNVRLLKRVY